MNIRKFKYLYFILFIYSMVCTGQIDFEYEKKIDSLWVHLYDSTDKVLSMGIKLYEKYKAAKNYDFNKKMENLIGAAYLTKEEYTKAIPYFLKSAESSKKAGNERGIYVASTNLGAIYIKLNNFSKAKVYLLKALEYFEKARDSSSFSSIYNNLGLCFQNLGEPMRALEFFKKARKIFAQNKDEQSYLFSISNIVSIYSTLKLKDSVIMLSEKGIRLAQKLNDPDIEFQILRELYSFIKDDKTLMRMLDLDYKNLNLYNAVIYLELKINYLNKYRKYKEAVEYFDILDSIKTILHNQENTYQARMMLMENEFKEMKKEDSIKADNERKLAAMRYEKQKIQNQRNNMLKWSFIAISIIVSGFLFVLFNRFKIIQKQKAIIEEQNKITQMQKMLIEEKQKEMVDSINYARRIQNSLIEEYKTYLNYFKEHFFIYMPKDIVSGDFIWCAEKDGYLFLACCDSTGHGVPGSYMSLLNMALLSEAVNEKNIIIPCEILDYVRNRLVNTISKNKENKDGFDGALIRLPISSGKVTSGEVLCASANQKIIIIKSSQIQVLEFDHMPVGYYENQKPFRNFTVTLNKNDIIILSSDGYFDQFGGDRNKKFTFKRFGKILTENLPVSDLNYLQNQLMGHLINWKAGNDQTDDICLVGIKI
ncbi:MAG: SpoIIE family protein phosphatase [Bacteroidia bacterium]|nr:SpoIIE family protein phosphatase [Bacteroidia bacterium]